MDNIEKFFIGSMIFFVVLVSFIGIKIFLDYEGYFCKTIEYKEGNMNINAWCGHNGKLITNSTGTFWHIEGWNFGDFP